MRLILTASFFIAFSCISQIYLKPTIYPSTPGNSDGSFKVELMGYPGNVTYTMTDLYTGMGTEFTDSISGFDYSGVNTAFEAYALNQLTGDTIAYLSINTPRICSSLDISYLLQPLTQSSCDGSIHANFIPDTNEFSGTMALHFGQFQIGSPDGIWNNLCASKSTLTISNGVGFFIDMTVIIEPANIINSTTFNATVFSTVSSETNCTSTSYVNTVGSTAPYYYSWDYDNFTLADSAENVCPGIHNVRIVDNQNDTLSLNYAVVDSSNAYLDYITGPVLDTISFNTQNCSFDYTLQVDSTEMSFFSAVNDTMFYFEMNIWQSGNLTQVSDTVVCHYSQTGYNLFSLTMYCLLKGPGQKIYQIVDRIDMSLAASVESNEPYNVLIYPNPANDVIHIKHELLDYSEIYAANGKLALTTRGDEINISQLESGIYFLTIYTTSSHSFTKKIVIH